MKRFFGLLITFMLLGNYLASQSIFLPGQGASLNNYTGIGSVSTPPYQLTVKGPYSDPQSLISHDGSNGIFFHAQGNASHYNWLIGQQRIVNEGLEFTPSTMPGGNAFSNPTLVLKANGNVGIGNNQPDAKLHITDPSIITSFGGDQNTGIRIENKYPDDHFSLLGFGGWSDDFPRNLAQIGAKLTHSGSYLFFGTSSDYAQGITNSAMVIDFNGKVGIGTSNPLALLHSAGASQINSPYPGSANGVGLAISNTDRNYGITMGTAPSGSGWIQQMRMDGNSTLYNLILQPAGGNVGIGTNNVGDYKLNVSGKIRANEIIVNTSGADFVFDPEYNLPDLAEVEKYIEENKHLPDVAPASVMQTEGMSVSEMQTKMLQKNEELTLYIIEQDKRIQDLEKKRNHTKL